ncbi:MAG: winged helix-turn-helix domain-containing protein [Paludibacter sp.]|nr:winged helix-turn-helix domain-containing protein [Paludibacter sp.]
MKLETEKLVLLGLNPKLRELMKISVYEIGNFTFDVENRLLKHGKEAIKLTSKESYLLVMLAANPNTFLQRKDILNTIWGEDSFRASRSMDVYICKLRRLLSKESNINIVNYHGKGHKLIIAQ